MKKSFLLAAMVAAGVFSAIADMPAPIELDDAFIYALSPNGKYAVSENSLGIKIYDLASDKVDEFIDESGMTEVACGIGNCVSDNGIVVGSSDGVTPQYCKDGEWIDLPVGQAVNTSLCNAITPDGSRICGSLGLNALSFDGDALMQVPCIWNATANGYSEPVVLPYPEKDFSGRVPIYVTATDMSADGKIIIGQVMNATGMISYPLIYKEAADGTWTYEIVDEKSLVPEGVVFNEFPGDGPRCPQPEEYMTAEEEAEYADAYQNWIDSGYNSDLYPEVTDFMDEEEIAEYEADLAKYQEEYSVWEEKYYTWFEALEKCMANIPLFVFNSMKMSPDGKYFGGTVQIEEPGEGWWDSNVYMNVWIGDTENYTYTKYDQEPDLNLTYLANEGVGLASTSVWTSSQSWVLKNSTSEAMYDWMASKSSEYADYMMENMTFGIEQYDWDTGEFTYKEEFMSGRAVSTPSLDVMALTVQNLWDYMTDAEAFVFNLAQGSSVKGVEVVKDGETVVYDLQGRKLNNVVAPGIYIVNGEKKVVR